MELWINHLIAQLALPQYSQGTVFVVRFVPATLLPMDSEPVAFGLITINSESLWQVFAVATLGNKLGRAMEWWMGYGAHQVADKYSQSQHLVRALDWLRKLAAKACLLGWLPHVGVTLCAVVCWMRMPILLCLLHLAVDELLRYVVLTWTMLDIFGS